MSNLDLSTDDISMQSGEDEVNDFAPDAQTYRFGIIYRQKRGNLDRYICLYTRRYHFTFGVF